MCCRWDGGIRLGSPAINGRGVRLSSGRHASANNQSYGGGPSGSLSDESDSGEVLPPAPGMQGRSPGAEMGADGKWFTALDER